MSGYCEQALVFALVFRLSIIDKMPAGLGLYKATPGGLESVRGPPAEWTP